MFPIV
jgi:hypothetical protein